MHDPDMAMGLIIGISAVIFIFLIVMIGAIAHKLRRGQDQDD